MNGIIVLDKPAGLSSFTATDKVRQLTGSKKAGHTGTLDPFATGVLVVCLNQATRLVPYLQEGEKEYIADICLGQVRDTDDLTGQIVATHPLKNFSIEEINLVLKQFEGKIQQIPPMYSALKVNGQRLYKIARQGGKLERHPRQVTIHAVDFLSLDLPDVKIRVICSKGTYIRTLAHDIGDKLKCGGYLKSLRRIKNGEFKLEQALTLEDLKGSFKAKILSLESVTSDFCSIQLSADLVEKARHGNQIELILDQNATTFGKEPVRLTDQMNSVIAIAEIKKFGSESMLIQPKIVFNQT